MIQIRKFSFLLLTAALVTLGVIAGFFACAYTLGVDPSGEDQNRVWITRAELDELNTLADKYTKAELLSEYISSSYYTEVDPKVLTDGVYYGLFAALGDPYSEYLNEEEFENMKINTQGDYCGIGVTMSPTQDNAHIYAAGVTEGAPAEEAGVKVGDLILKVDGVAYTGAQLSECASSARGDAGTQVILTLKRGEKEFDVQITRRRILANTVKCEMLEDQIGYIRITSFEDPTYKDFKNALTSLEDGGAKGLVVDIRGNGGGFVDTAVKIADELMDKATVVYTEDHNGNREYYTTKDGKTKLPFVLLVNSGSASASEIMAAGIQDNAAAPIVGTVTYGKGIIQELKQLTDGTGVKLTIMQYFSPNGNVIHKVGITPDYPVELTKECYDEDFNLIHDLQLDKAVELLQTMAAD